MGHDLDRITEKIIGAAIAVHRQLGPGLLESAYEACLFFEIIRHGLQVQRQLTLPVVYCGIRVGCGYRIDLLVEDQVIVEIKSVGRIERIHRSQLLSYLRLYGRSVGLLFNFNVRCLTAGGIVRIVNNFQD